MFKVFANRDFLESVLLDQTPKNWYNIFMSGNIAEVCVPEDLDDEEVDSMGSIDIIGNLQLVGTTVKTDAEYIKDIPQNSRRVLENPNAVFLLDIETKKAEDIKELLVKHASSEFDWSEISPTIFGAIFESTLNPETRRKGGMHYTSIENIHKVIDPLFLDDLKAELAAIKEIAVDRTRDAKLRSFQVRLANLIFLDPACGSGNFLTETYISLRRST